jgi:hypothetical protein
LPLAPNGIVPLYLRTSAPRLIWLWRRHSFPGISDRLIKGLFYPGISVTQLFTVANRETISSLTIGQPFGGDFSNRSAKMASHKETFSEKKARFTIHFLFQRFA